MTSGLTVAFDADDTLWHNENAFAEVEQLFDELVAPWADATIAQRELVEASRQRLATYGYGVKSFALAMISTACELSNYEIPAETLHRFVDAADHLLAMPTVMIDGAADVIADIGERYNTMIITKGDLHHQLRRVAEVEVAKHCFDVEVVAEKDAATYQQILARHRIDPHAFVMIGNSVVSDVTPLLEIGAMAVHIPYEVTGALETGDDPAPGPRWFRCESIREVPTLLDRLSADLA
jgi:putative hydrolase of the HAD superfamily